MAKIKIYAGAPYQSSPSVEASGTVTACVNYKGKPYLLTHGHNCQVGENVYYSKTFLGKIEFVKFGGKVDMALVPIDINLFEPTRCIVNDQNKIDYLGGDRDLKLNDIVTRYGAITNTQGSVLNINYKCNIGAAVDDEILISNDSKPGDSGGPIVRNVNGKNYIIGSLSSHVDKAGDVVARMSNMMSECNLTLW